MDRDIVYMDRECFELQVEMSQSGSSCHQTHFCLFEVNQYHYHH